MNALRYTSRRRGGLLLALIGATIASPEASAFTSERGEAFGARGSLPWIEIQETEAVGAFRGVGIVTSVSPRARAVTLNHEEIKGFMAAMIMMYRVEPFSLAADLRPGDKVEFTIDAQSYTIRDIKLIERKK
jgi:Cu/Ag efflux protein CusF